MPPSLNHNLQKCKKELKCKKSLRCKKANFAIKDSMKQHLHFLTSLIAIIKTCYIKRRVWLGRMMYLQKGKACWKPNFYRSKREL
jgi:hypothetical protein